VHGREWCFEKGFGLGPDGYDEGSDPRRGDYGEDRRYDDDRYDDDGRYGDGRYEEGRYEGDGGRYGSRRWRRASAEGIAFRASVIDRLRGDFGEAGLRRVIGGETTRRLRRYQRRIGLRGELEGRFTEGGGLGDVLGGVLGGDGDRVLEVSAGGRALARFIDDGEGDDRVDVVLLRRRR
jgi:hypothetical protein